jgi:hypothetical protein
LLGFRSKGGASVLVHDALIENWINDCIAKGASVGEAIDGAAAKYCLTTEAIKKARKRAKLALG